MEATNPLGTEPIGKLMLKFAIPSVVGMLVGASYNVVDQIFIGHGVGYLGNAATNVDFPIAIIALALGLLFGIGGASNYSLALGAKQTERASRVVGNSLLWITVAGVILTIIVRTFLKPIVILLGATPEILPYAMTYTGITCLGLPFAMLGVGFNNLIRADGSPKYSMLCMISGCIINTALNPLFIFVFDMGVAGAAWATVIAQVITCIIGAIYLPRYRNAKLTRDSFRPNRAITASIVAIGVGAFINQVSLSVIQVALNNTLTKYGAESVYGSEIPLACAGMITKVSMLFFSVVIGISMGCQPIFGFNYGAKLYGRVRQTYRLALICCSVISVFSFLAFQIFPRQIISLFGTGTELYLQFSERYFRIFLLLAFLNGVQPITANFLSSIGKAYKGIFVSLTRQFIFLLPLIMVLPIFFGIDGVLYAGPVADGGACILAVILILGEMKKMRTMEAQMEANEA